MQSIFFTVIALGSALIPTLTSAWNADDIDLSIREGWCAAQTAQCPALCADKNLGTQENGCWPQNLYYSCVCSDGSRPNLTEYSETIPYYTCRLDQTDCITACGPSNNACSQDCTKKFVCGATDPKKTNLTSSASVTQSTTATAATTTGGAVFTTTDSNGFAVTGTVTSTPKKNDVAGSPLMQAGSMYSLGVVVAGIAFGAFVGL